MVWSSTGVSPDWPGGFLLLHAVSTLWQGAGVEILQPQNTATPESGVVHLLPMYGANLKWVQQYASVWVQHTCRTYNVARCCSVSHIHATLVNDVQLVTYVKWDRKSGQ